MNFEGLFKNVLEEYVLLKRSMGYKYSKSTISRIKQLNIFLELYNLKHITLTKDIVDTFTTCKDKSTNIIYNRQLLIRDFSIFLTENGYKDIYIHPNKFIKNPRNFTPHIYSEIEIFDIFKTIDNSRFLYTEEYKVLFRILYGCGLRISEALNLKISDIDFNGRILIIYKSKNDTSRLVPMSETLTNVVFKYYSKNVYEKEEYFLKIKNRNNIVSTIDKHFKIILEDTGIDKSARVHDLRHTFSVNTLDKMCDTGMDIYTSLPILMTYLGHRNIKSTEYYLRLTKHHYSKITDTLDVFYQDVLPKVDSHEE